jgi:hypothetical protein
MNRQSFDDVLLAKWKSWSKSEWSWRRTSLLIMAGIALVDSLFIPMSRDVDPGRSAEGILFLVLGFRAAARRIDRLRLLLQQLRAWSLSPPA